MGAREILGLKDGLSKRSFILSGLVLTTEEGAVPEGVETARPDAPRRDVFPAVAGRLSAHRGGFRGRPPAIVGFGGAAPSTVTGRGLLPLAAA